MRRPGSGGGAKDMGLGAKDMGLVAKHQIFPPLPPLDHISHNNPVDPNLHLFLHPSY